MRYESDVVPLQVDGLYFSPLLRRSVAACVVACTWAQNMYSPADGVTIDNVQLIFEGNKLSGDMSVQVRADVRLVVHWLQCHAGAWVLPMCVPHCPVFGVSRLLRPGPSPSFWLYHSSADQEANRRHACISPRGVRWAFGGWRVSLLKGAPSLFEARCV